MNSIRVLLMRPDAPVVQAQYQFEPGSLPPQVAAQLVSISVGSNEANSIVTLPLDILTLIMGRVMAKAASQPGKPGLVVPDSGLVGADGKKLS